MVSISLVESERKKKLKQNKNEKCRQHKFSSMTIKLSIYEMDRVAYSYQIAQSQPKMNKRDGTYKSI